MQVWSRAAVLLAALALSVVAPASGEAPPVYVPDPALYVDDGDPLLGSEASLQNLFANALERGCRRVVTAGDVRSLVVVDRMQQGLGAPGDETLLDEISTAVAAETVGLLVIRKGEAGYAVSGALYDRPRKRTLTRAVARADRADTVGGAVVQVGTTLGRATACPGWRGAVVIRRTIERSRAGDSAPMGVNDRFSESTREEVAFAFGDGTVTFTATYATDSRQITAGTATSQSVTTVGEAHGAGRLDDGTRWFVDVKPDGLYIIALDDVALASTMKVTRATGETTITTVASGDLSVRGTRRAGRVAPGTRTLSGTATEETTEDGATVTEIVTWDLTYIE
jgi:hypothetical protein